MSIRPSTKNASTRASTTTKRKTGRRPGRPVSLDQFDGREVLLTAAHELLLESRGLPVSLNHICAHAGVNQAMVSYHFGSKHELMIALFERVSADWAPPLAVLLKLDVDAPRKLEIHIRQIISNLQKFPYVSRLMTELMLTSDRRVQKRLSNSFVVTLLDFYRAIIDEGYRAGALRPVEPLHMFLSIVGLCEYLFVAQPMLDAGLGISEITEDLERAFAKHTTELVLYGISVRKKLPDSPQPPVRPAR